MANTVGTRDRGQGTRLLRVEVDAMELVMVCRLAGREAERQMKAAQEEGDPKGVIEARADSDRVKRLLLTAVGRIPDPVEVADEDSTGGRGEE